MAAIFSFSSSSPKYPAILATAAERGIVVNTIQCGGALELLSQVPSESIDCCVTSPPYWNLRDYGAEGQLGLEASFLDYIHKLCSIFEEIKRVLKPEGTCWVNLGDTYSKTEGCSKSLLQLPSRFSLEMCNQGWILRNEIIWWKPNAMPSSAKDRFTVDFEKLYFFTKTPDYHFAAQYEPHRHLLPRQPRMSVSGTPRAECQPKIMSSTTYRLGQMWFRLSAPSVFGSALRGRAKNLSYHYTTGGKK